MMKSITTNEKRRDFRRGAPEIPSSIFFCAIPRYPKINSFQYAIDHTIAKANSASKL